MKIILASRSPRRSEALSQLGIPFICVEPKADETLMEGTDPQHGVMILAKRKAEEVADFHPDAVCIGADTLVVLRGQILGKPQNAADAFRMLKQLQNETHDVYTGLCVGCKALDRFVVDYRHAAVRFLPMTDEEIEAYVKTDEPMDKAGSYGIQGKAAAFINGIVGSHDTVVGMPMALLRQMLKEFGISV